MTRWIAPLIGAAALLSLAIIKEPPVSLVRPPSILSQHQPVSFQVRVPKSDVNRLLIVAATDDVGIVSQSHEMLEGASAPRTRWIEWKGGIPVPGNFILIAALYGVSGQELGRDTHPVTVQGVGP